MPFCTQCGFNNDDDARFCNSCGHELEPIVTSTSNKRKSGKLWMTMSLVLLAIAIAATVWHLGSWDQSSKTPSTTRPKTTEQKTDKTTPTTTTPDVKQEVAKVVESVFGSDQELGELPVKPTPLSSGLKDIDRSNDYSFSEQNCTDLYTDIGQQAAYSIESELVKVTQIPEQDENQLGKEIAKMVADEFKGKLDTDAAWLNYIQTLGKNLISRVNRKGIAYHFHVISDNVEDAFAIPGGGIYVFTGILNQCRNEAQIAEILAHEIKHVDLRHCIALYQILSRLPDVLQNPAFIVGKMMKHPYNARAEADADRRGLELIYSFGYSPYQAVAFWEKASSETEGSSKQTGGLIGQVIGQVIKEAENVLSTHPNPGRRACLLKNHTIKLQRQYPMDRVYVGKWNYENKTPMSQRQI